MAFPGVLVGGPIYNPGTACLTPEFRELFWVEDLAAPQPRFRYVYVGLNPTYRTDQAETGYAEVAAVVDEDGYIGIQAELILENVWDVVLLDSFDDDICPPPGWDRDAPLSERTPFFLGGKDSRIRLLALGNRDDANIVSTLFRPNPIAPGGLGASCLFQNLYLAVETWTGGFIKVTPIVNGEKLDDEAIAFAVPFPGVGGERGLHRFEIPLTREYDSGSGVVSRAGLVGTWFSCEILVEDSWGCGRLAVADPELEFEVLENHHLGLAFTGEVMPDPTRVPRTPFFLGQADGYLLRYGTDNQDALTDFGCYGKTNDLAPAGTGGECLFAAVYFSVTRNNTEEWSCVATPIVDGVDLEPVTLTFGAIAGGKMVTEHQEIFLAQPYKEGGSTEQSLFHPRGAWFQLRIEADDTPNSHFTFEGFELEFVVVRESLEDVTNAE